jgi:peptidoglycan hydrolase CwlO-like protein
MFGFFTTDSRIAALQKTAAGQAKDIETLIGLVEQLQSKVETLEGEFAHIGDEIEEQVERQVDRALDTLEVSISR